MSFGTLKDVGKQLNLISCLDLVPTRSLLAGTTWRLEINPTVWAFCDHDVANRRPRRGGLLMIIIYLDFDYDR